MLFYGTAGLAQVPPKDEVRSLYQQALTEKEAAEKLIKLLEPYDSKHPLLLGYKASGVMLIAKYSFNPFKTLKYFKEGKNMLQKAIEADKKNVDYGLPLGILGNIMHQIMVKKKLNEIFSYRKDKLTSLFGLYSHE